MKLNQKSQNVTIGGDIIKSTEFKVAMNPKMFKLLSDMVYADKIGSLIREISSNALDGHSKAGYPERPFEVHLPNAIEPYFSVKDTGTGITPEDMDSVYTSYGESTKDSSNDEVGAFGLGAKTPFAYTDQFTVISITGGIKRTYQAMMGNDLMPSIHLHDETPTEEPNGVEVIIAVDNNDFNEFKTKLFKELRFFNVKPIVLNDFSKTEFENFNEKITYNSDDATIFDNTNSLRNKIWIVQGGVGYNLKIDKLNGIEKYTREFANELATQGCILRFPIGEIGVTASREDISYEQPTITNIIDKLNDLSKQLTNQLLQTLKSEKTLWQRVIIFNDQMPFTKTAIQNLPEYTTLFKGTYKGGYRNKKLGIDISSISKLGFKVVRLVEHSYHSKGTYYSKSRLRREIISENNNSFNNTYDNMFIPTNDLNVLYRDTKKKPMARLSLYCETHNYPPMIIIESSMGEIVEDTDMKQVCELLGIPFSKTKKLSSFPAPTVTKQGTPADKRPRAYKFNNSNYQTSKNWDHIYTEIDNLEEGYYVCMDRHDIMPKSHNYSEFEMFAYAITKNLLTKPLYAVNKQTYNRIKDGKIGSNLTYWADDFHIIRDEFDKFFPVWKKTVTYNSFVNGLSTHRLIRELDNNNIILNKMNVVSRRLNQLTERMGAYHDMIEKFVYKLTNIDSHDLIELTNTGSRSAAVINDKFFSKYPMLRYIGHFPTDEDINNAKEYIKMIEGA